MIFLVLLLGCGVFAIIGSQQTSSRLTYSFARDNTLVLSKFIGRIHPTLDVPVWALLANWLVVFVVGCIYLGSTTVFNASSMLERTTEVLLQLDGYMTYDMAQ